MKNTIISIATAPFLILSAYAGDIIDFGAKTKTPSAVTAAQLKLNEDTGFVITDVREGSAAATLGLKKNDIVTAVNGKSIANIVSLSEYIAAICADGAEVDLTWSSGREVKTGKVSVTEKTDREDFIAALSDVLIYNSRSIYNIMNDTVTLTAGEFVFTSTKGDGLETKKHLKIAKKYGGAVKFEGDINPNDLSNVPKELREETKQFLNSMSGMGPQGATLVPTLEKDIDALVEDIDNDN